MDDKRVSEWELAELNPGKQFLPDFKLSGSKYVLTYPISDDKNVTDVGAPGMKLLELVADIRGVSSVRISTTELRVFKFASHKWEELTPKIREAFKQVYGNDIEFQAENTVILAIRRLRIKLSN